jgi:hypothetical protein
MKWEKKGIILKTEDLKADWIVSHVQLPTPYRVNEDLIRIYVSVRNKEGKARPIYIDVDAHNYNVMSIYEEPLLELGKQGTFDDCGIMFSSCVEFENKLYMYYVGWNQDKVLPYTLSIGLAISTDGGRSFVKASEGPVLDRDFECPYFCGSPYVFKDGNYLRMYYVYCTEWQYNKEDGWVPAYLIRSAFSKDGIEWIRDKKDSLSYNNKHEAISRPWGYKCNDKYYMWYSYRDTKEFRNNKDNAYTIGLAESKDGNVWKRIDKEVGIGKSETGWDSVMMCYPAVIENNGKLVMFYNGNEHGKYAFGYAIGDIRKMGGGISDIDVILKYAIVYLTYKISPICCNLHSSIM